VSRAGTGSRSGPEADAGAEAAVSGRGGALTVKGSAGVGSSERDIMGDAMVVAEEGRLSVAEERGSSGGVASAPVGSNFTRDEDARLICPKLLRGLTLRVFLPRPPLPAPLPESKLPVFAMSCRQLRMRSEGGCVLLLSRRVRPLVRVAMLLGRLRAPGGLIFLEKTDEVSQASFVRSRFWYAQSCLKTFMLPV